jgi:hypothetical protein
MRFIICIIHLILASKSRRMKWARHVAQMRRWQIHIKWENNVKIDRKIGWKGVDWIHLALDRNWWQAFLMMAMNLEVP